MSLRAKNLHDAFPLFVAIIHQVLKRTLMTLTLFGGTFFLLVFISCTRCLSCLSILVPSLRVIRRWTLKTPSDLSPKAPELVMSGGEMRHWKVYLDPSALPRTSGAGEAGAWGSGRASLRSYALGGGGSRPNGHARKCTYIEYLETGTHRQPLADARVHPP